MTEPVVFLDRVAKSYRPEAGYAVEALTLSIAPGTLFGFVGPNGAGKTTTISLLVGAATPSVGRIELFGQPFTPDAIALKRRLGYVPSEDALFAHLTGDEQVSLSALVYGLDPSAAESRKRELFNLLDLGDARRRPIRDYSHGMRRKVALACGLIHDPDLLLLDEPLEGIDVMTARALKSIFSAMVARGKTVFITSHNLTLIEDVCSRVAIIARGRLLFDGSPEEAKQKAGLASTERLEDAFVDIVGESGPAPQLSWLGGPRR